MPLETLIEVHDAHAEAFRQSLRAGEGPWPGQGRGSWDEVSGRLGCGKCDFKNVLAPCFKHV